MPRALSSCLGSLGSLTSARARALRSGVSKQTGERLNKGVAQLVPLPTEGDGGVSPSRLRQGGGGGGGGSQTEIDVRRLHLLLIRSPARH